MPRREVGSLVSLPFFIKGDSMSNYINKFKATLAKLFHAVAAFFVNYVTFFVKGDYKTRLSYIVMGAGSFLNHQVVHGLAYLCFEVAFIAYMVNDGFYFISMLPTLGTQQQGEVFDEATGLYMVQKGDNSMLLLLFGVIAIVLWLVFIALHYSNVKHAYKNQCLIAEGKRPESFKEECQALLNERFHVTILALPAILTILFTVLPLIFMILMAFTNFDKNHQPPGNLFTWVGLSNFHQVFVGNPLWAKTFQKLFVWTMIWAFFATFLNYIAGIVLALIINQKRVRFKKLWRTMFVITIAVPQFVSLLLVSKFLLDQGPLNGLLLNLGWIKHYIPFLSNALLAKITVIVVNLWIGIPYTMLICTGILMNIPQNLYEASLIDGASPFKQFTKITMPYMLQVTTPYLITQFVGNINNFNVIYLLTGGDPKTLDLYQAGETDLLVTWLYKLTVSEKNYALASTIGIIIFVITAVISLIAYNNAKAVKEEDQFQ